MSNSNYTFYNPETNKLARGRYSRQGFFSLGNKKIAEAFTSVDPKERKKLWIALNSTTYSFNFKLLDSKLRHKLKRLGLKQLSIIPLSKGEKLLLKIKNIR